MLARVSLSRRSVKFTQRITKMWINLNHESGVKNLREQGMYPCFFSLYMVLILLKIIIIIVISPSYHH